MYCPECGVYVPNDALFCGECGANLTENDLSSDNDRTENYLHKIQYDNSVNHQVIKVNDFGKRIRNDNKLLAAVIISVALVISTVIMLIVFLSDKHNDRFYTQSDSSDTVTESGSNSAGREDMNGLSESQSIHSEAGQELPAFSDALISGVSSSSFLVEKEYNYYHSPSNVIDKNLSTAWVEGIDGNGEGESLVISFNEVCLLSGFTINNGYQKSERTYRNNSRVSALMVSFSNDYSFTVPIDDSFEQQKITFDSAVETSNIAFTIIAVYSGEKYSDTAISEISLF